MIEATPLYSRTEPGYNMPYHEYEWHYKMKRFSWQPVFAGIVAALAIQVLLALFAVAFGFASAAGTDPAVNPTAETVTVGALMWAGVSLLSSLFYGGFMGARLTKSSCHHEGILHGIAVWAGTVLVLVILASTAAGATFGGSSQLMGRFTGGMHMHHDRPMAAAMPLVSRRFACGCA